MDDRTLLEKAAKAAGLKVWDWMPDHGFAVETAPGHYGRWTPIADDGDSQRLSVKLEFNVYHAAGAVYVERLDDGVEVKVPHGSDPYAATRRAIVRAAAAMEGE